MRGVKLYKQKENSKNPAPGGTTRSIATRAVRPTRLMMTSCGSPYASTPLIHLASEVMGGTTVVTVLCASHVNPSLATLYQCVYLVLVFKSYRSRLLLALAYLTTIRPVITYLSPLIRSSLSSVYHSLRPIRCLFISLDA